MTILTIQSVEVRAFSLHMAYFYFWFYVVKNIKYSTNCFAIIFNIQLFYLGFKQKEFGKWL
jgi:hypothetical protein